MLEKSGVIKEQRKGKIAKALMLVCEEREGEEGRRRERE